MRDKHVNILQGLLLISLSTLLSGVVHAVPIYDTSKDVAGLRGRISKNEGYLSYHHVYKPYGEERTGWTDVRHPALDGTVDNKRGYDWSDNQVRVLTHNVNEPGPGGDTNVQAEDRRRDIDVANAALAQAGITVRQAGNATIAGNNIRANADGSPNLSDISTLFGTGRSPNATTVNQYYVDKIPKNYGIAYPPNFAAANGYNNGFAIGDDSRAIANKGSSTFAHELSHFLLDDNRFTTGDTWHSSRRDDLLHADPIDPNPEAYKIASDKFGLREPGKNVGNIGTHSHLNENVTHRTSGDIKSQIRALNESPYVSHKDNGLTYGDVADFDWVEDNWNLERAGGKADNHPTFDPMVWEIGPIAHSTHTDHQHDAWGELNRAAFKGPNFRVVDIVSQIGRYIDMDVDPATKNWSARASALDYEVPKFSKDGVNWVDGILHRVFTKGWTDKSEAENYVSRWISPVEAKYARIVAADHESFADFDGNAQIDAILAARGPYRNGLNKTVFGAKKNPTVSYDALTGKLSFGDGVINVLNRNGVNEGVDASYLFDSLLGATLSISDFSLISPFDDGFLFGDGTISLMRDGITLLSADIPFLLIDDLMKDAFGINMIGDLGNMIIDQALSSLFLDDFMNDYLLADVITTELFGLTSFDLVPLIAAGLSFVNYDVALFGSHSVPEPAVWLMLLTGLALLAGARRWRPTGDFAKTP